MRPWLQKTLGLVLKGVGKPAQNLMDALNGIPATGKVRATPLDQLLETGVRVMWVAAHPDDESLAGAILVKAGPVCKNPLYFLVLTHGEGGESAVPANGPEDVARLRGEEMVEVAALYGATLQHEHFWNAPLPVESFPKRQDIAARWLEQGNLTRLIAQALVEFRPDVVLTFAPDFGATGHPEHQLTSRFATAGIRMAADPAAGLGGDPHRVPHVYYVLNRHWLAAVGRMGNDPFPHTETFDALQTGPGGKSLGQTAADYTLPHRTQGNDMGAIRRLLPIVDRQHLYRVDPFVEIKDPLEKRPRGGMW